jgi:hypothetical protein
MQLLAPERHPKPDAADRTGLLRKNYEKAIRVHDSRCQRFQAIVVMQSRQDRAGDDSVAIRDSVPILPVDRHVGNARSEAGVWSHLVGVRLTPAGRTEAAVR